MGSNIPSHELHAPQFQTVNDVENEKINHEKPPEESSAMRIPIKNTSPDINTSTEIDIEKGPNKESINHNITEHIISSPILSRSNSINNNNNTSTESESESESDNQDLEGKLADAHVNILPTNQIIIVFLSLGFSLVIGLIDQTGISVILSSISKSLNAKTTISWAGTSSMIGNCVFQVIFGRLADIFGRKYVLIGSMYVFVLTEILCGLSKNGIEFYIFRAFSGAACGGIMSLTMVIASDVVTLRQRGKFQGILGSFIGTSNTIAPFIASGFTVHVGWKYFFFFLACLMVLFSIVSWYFIPNTHSPSSTREKFKQIDYFGFLFSTGALTLLLIPISSGGSTYKWDSPIVISMFCIGGILLIIFVLIEWKVAILPMMPLRLYTSPMLGLLMFQNIFVGIVYSSGLYFYPYYFEVCLDKSLMSASILMIPMVISLSAIAAVGGILQTRYGKYMTIIRIGYTLWTTGVGMSMKFDLNTSDAYIVGSFLLQGLGIGWVFQPTLIASQAYAKKSDRAVVISSRNVLRSFGGALGLAISSTIVANTLKKKINRISDDILPETFKNQIINSVYSKPDLSTLTTYQKRLVQQAYVSGIHNVFIFFFPLAVFLLITSFLIKDRGLAPIDEKDESEEVGQPTFRGDVKKMVSHVHRRHVTRDMPISRSAA